MRQGRFTYTWRSPKEHTRNVTTLDGLAQHGVGSHEVFLPKIVIERRGTKAFGERDGIHVARLFVEVMLVYEAVRNRCDNERHDAQKRNRETMGEAKRDGKHAEQGDGVCVGWPGTGVTLAR